MLESNHEEERLARAKQTLEQLRKLQDTPTRSSITSRLRLAAPLYPTVQ